MKYSPWILPLIFLIAGEWVQFKDLVDYSMWKNASAERDGILEQRYAPLGFYCGFGCGWDCDCN